MSQRTESIEIWGQKGKISLMFCMAFGLCIYGILASLTGWSSFHFQLHDLLRLWQEVNPHDMTQQVLRYLRAPRTLCSLLIGSNLAIAGVLMQALTRNPLASPSVLGVNAGAACAITLASLSIPIFGEISVLVAALVGAAIVGVAVMILGGIFQPNTSPLRLILAGIAMGMFLMGVTRFAVILSDEQAYSMLQWLAGTLSNTTWHDWAMLWPCSLAGSVLALSIVRKLNLLMLGEKMAQALGTNLIQLRILACLSILLLSAVSVAVAGPIGFVGLLIPHIARKLVGHSLLLLLPMSAILGAGLLTCADAISRGVSYPTETPVGLITALIGTPCFLLIVLKRRNDASA
ncbi:FecCD family ABC transporter permease [Algicola sagamiensis]|uniref:FecCD family ABC transporter permease n=1 Tax=Algicola sagamiensis TaxID=163869 RepID=UPI0006872D9A|nr:iron chelate uptake ABC transporter family permease subunit [Algicola sagamiensis]